MIPLDLEMVNSNGRMVARVSARYADDKPPYIDRVSLDSSRSRRAFARKVAERCEIPEDEIDEELLRVAEEQANQPTVQELHSPPKPELTPQERAQAEAFLSSPTLMDDIGNDIEELGVAGERDLSLLVYLVATSRILEEPLGGILQGASSAGKSFILTTVGQLVPEESKICAVSLSQRAWYYFDEDRLSHKVVFLGEREQRDTDDTVDQRRALRELFTEGRLTRVVAKSDPGTNLFKSVPVTVVGPISYMESTTQERLLDEDASRVLLLRPDESEDQTKAIVNRIARDAEGGSISAQRRGEIIRRHHAAQRLLQEFTDATVVVPYASAISVPTEKIVARRACGHVMQVIKAIALLRVFQKSESRRDTIVADLGDYKLAKRLVEPVIARQLRDLDDAAEKLLGKLRGRGNRGPFSANEVAALLGVSHRQARRRVAKLVNSDVVSETSTSRPNRKEYELREVAARPGESSLLPDAEAQLRCIATKSQFVKMKMREREDDLRDGSQPL